MICRRCNHPAEDHDDSCAVRECGCEIYKPPAAETAVEAWSIIDPDTRRVHGVIHTRAPIRRI